MSAFEFKDRSRCDLCGSHERESFGCINWKDVRFSYVICCTCGLVYMNPVPTLESYLRFYKMDFWAIKAGKAEDWQGKQRTNSPQHSIIYQQNTRVPRVDAMLGNLLHSNSKVLEVGCGYGETLSYLQRRYDVIAYSVEPSDDAQEHLSVNHPNIQTIARSFEELYRNHYLDGMFDVVIFSHCLENILDVNHALNATRRILADDGYLYIDTPNLYWSGGMNPYHPVVFTPDTLRAFLKKHGFQIVKLDAAQNPGNLIADSLRAPKRWFNLIAAKGVSACGAPATNPAEVKRAFRAGRKVMALQTRVRRLRQAVTTRVRV